MAARLKQLVLDRIDLVDAPANPGSRVVLIKRDAAAKSSGPGAGAVHVNAPVGEKKKKPQAQPGMQRSGTVGKTAKRLSFVQRLAKAFEEAGKGAGPEEVADWAEGGDGNDPAKPAVAAPVEESAALKSMRVHHADLGKAIEAFGDTSKLAADHPVHALKASHAQLGKDIEAKVAEEAAAAPAAAPAAEPDGDEGVAMSVAEPYGPQTGEPGVGKMFGLIRRGVDKRFELMKSEIAKANKRADAAETIAKAERAARELDGVKVELRKFSKLAIDVEKEAPKYLLLKQAGDAVYQHALEVLKGAQAMIAKSDSLMDELGAAGDGVVGGSGEKSAWAAIEAEAAKLMGVRKSANGKELSKQQACAIVLEGKTAEHKKLMKSYYASKGEGSTATQ